MIKLLPGLPEQEYLALKWRNESYDTCRQVLPISIEHHRAYRNRVVNDSTVKMFTIVDRSPVNDSTLNPLTYTDKVVGQCGLTSIDPVYRKAEYSMLIGKEYTGKGYATEALKELLYMGFMQLGLKRIWGEVLDGNIAGVHIATKVGFNIEGVQKCTYFKHGQWLNSIIVGMTDDDYRARFLIGDQLSGLETVTDAPKA